MIYMSMVRGGLWASLHIMILNREGGDCFRVIPNPVVSSWIIMYYANRGDGIEKYAPELSSVPVWLTHHSCTDGQD